MRIDFEVNGKLQAPEVEPGEVLLPVLRRLGFWSVKHGCETGDCGACLVLVDGEPRSRACFPRRAPAAGRSRPSRDWATPNRCTRCSASFSRHGAVQCGYCTPAMLLAAAALLRRNPHPTEAAGARGAGRRPVPLHRLRETGGGHLKPRPGVPARPGRRSLT